MANAAVDPIRQKTPELFVSYRRYIVALVAAACTALAVYLLDLWMAAHGMHAETTKVDDILLAVFTGGFVFALESSHQRDRQRARQLEESNTELLKQAEAVRDLSGRLMSMQDQERRRIARDLHDSVGQLVVAATLNFSTVAAEAQRLTPAGGQAVSEAAALLRQISQEIRTISHLLHPPLLDEVGLESALRWYVEGFADRSKIAVQLEVSPGLGRLRQEVETSIFRIVQESLTNIHRHSGSKTAAIRLNSADHELRLEIRDQGRGIAADKSWQMRRSGGAGVGIRGMQERIRELGGRLEVKSQPGAGTTVTAILPLVRDAGAQASRQAG